MISRTIEVCDLTDQDRVSDLVAYYAPDAIIHAAAYIPRTGDKDIEACSRRGNLNTAESILRAASLCASTRIVVNISSIAVYGEKPDFVATDFSEAVTPVPDSVYGNDKLAAERLFAQWALETGRHCVSLRLAGIHGSGRKTGVIATMIRKVLNDEPIQIASPETRIAPLPVQDVVRAVAVTLDRLASSEYLPTAINIGGEETSLLNLAHIIGELCQQTPKILAGETPPVRRIMATELAQKVLAFQPKPLQDWLVSEVDIYRSNSTLTWP